MKKFIYLLAGLIISSLVFAQAKLPDGIYRVDQSGARSAENSGQAFVHYNPFFLEDEPEDYDPIPVDTVDFVPLELADIPVVQHLKNKQNFLLVRLTVTAAQKLKEFTTRNTLDQIVVVVNDQALAVYKITEPVNGQLIKVTQCSDDACSLIYWHLKRAVKMENDLLAPCGM